MGLKPCAHCANHDIDTDKAYACGTNKTQYTHYRIFCRCCGISVTVGQGLCEAVKKNAERIWNTRHYEIVAAFAESQFCQSDLDAMVHAVCEKFASDVNNNEQRKYLLKNRYTEDVIEGMEQSDLDDIVYDLHSELASNTNNQGHEFQISFLIANGLTEEKIKSALL